ncbi:MAG: NADH-quinone oxidoreductase subunit J, partial [Armatimonadetes bacterium]|nr:NADH-quinone oxidoreductase subunit J [Armatimonadota bacterium]
LGTAFAGVFVAIMAFVFWTGRANGEAGPYTPNQMVEQNTELVAMQIFSVYLLPFELTSVMLLIAMIGAIVLAKRQLD